MSVRRALVSGDVLVGRYELQDLVSERLGSTTWRAHDRVLSRNVGLEMLPSNDPRATHFLEAARQSTAVTDPRFLRVMDLIEDDHGHHLVIREWARAFSLDQLLLQSPLSNRRAASVVAEVAEAIAHAHEHGVHHRRLSPHHVLLKESGAVRVVGLGVASALAPVGHHDSAADLHAYERLDVESLGKLLYACLTSRWPGGYVDQLRAAPTEHGRLLRPRQVRAGVTRDVDTVADRILGAPPRHHERPLRSATEVGMALRALAPEDVPAGQSPVHQASTDLLRRDPVVVPAGPPPGLEPPRRRPKAFEPPPPTPLERAQVRAKQAAKGDRGLVLLGIIGTLVLASVIAFLVGRSTGDTVPTAPFTASSELGPLEFMAAGDIDPQGDDRAENPEEVHQVIDGDPSTGWRTATYFGRRDLGGIKDGVGVALDLGGPRELRNLTLRLAGTSTDLSVYVSSPSASFPTSRTGLERVARITDAGKDVSIRLPEVVLTRYVVVWLTGLPEIADGEYRGEIREVTATGRS